MVDGLAGYAPVLVCRCQRQTWVKPKVLRCSYPILFDAQEPVLPSDQANHEIGAIGIATVALHGRCWTSARVAGGSPSTVHTQKSRAARWTRWVKFLGEGEWKTKKHGAERRRQWRKVHLGIDAENMQIRAMVVTTNEVGDSPVAAGLLGQIPNHEIVASFTGDGAYDTKDVHEACHHRKAIPVIPPRKGARLRKGLAFAHRNEAVKACKKLGRTIWKRWSGYHRRSLVETKMNCFKRLGEKVMARTFERQVAELNIRASILNRFTELGTPQTVAVA